MEINLNKKLMRGIFLAFFLLSFNQIVQVAEAGYSLNYVTKIENSSDGVDHAYLWHATSIGNRIYIGSYVSQKGDAQEGEDTETKQKYYWADPPYTNFTPISLLSTGNHESCRPHVLNGDLFVITERGSIFKGSNEKDLGDSHYLLGATYFDGKALFAYSKNSGEGNNATTGTKLYDADGSQWKNFYKGDIKTYGMTVFNNELYLFGQDENTDYSNMHNVGKIVEVGDSGNATTINISGGAPGCYQGIVYNNNLYVGCGSRDGGTAGIYKLENGTFVKSGSFGVNNFGSMAIYDNKLFAAGVKNNGGSQVIYFDGTSWKTAFNESDFQSKQSDAGNSSGLNQPGSWLVAANNSLYLFDNSKKAGRYGPSYLFSITGNTENPENPGSCIIEDELTDSTTIGTKTGGAFSDSGWKHVAAKDKIKYTFSSMTSGVVEFDVTNMNSASWSGGPDEYDYYFGMYDDGSGDKFADYTGAAFIEVRANYTTRYPDKIKMQSGAGKTAEEISEMFGKNETFESSEIYHHKIVFGGGKATLYIDDVEQVTTTYEGTINWNTIYIGDTNYKGSESAFTGMEDFIFSNIQLSSSGNCSENPVEPPVPPPPVVPPSNSATINIYLRDDSCFNDQGYRMLSADPLVWKSSMSSCTNDGVYYCVDDNQKCSTAPGSASATVSTDKDVYAPGETITVSSSGSFVTSCSNPITSNIAAEFQGETKVISTDTFTSKGDFSNNGSVTFTAPTTVGSYTLTVGMDYSHPPFYYNRAVTLNFEVSETGEETDCTTTEDCAENFTCEEGKCVANSTTECTTLDDCDANATCEEGYCVVKASNSEDCIVDDPGCDEHVCQDLYCLDGCNYLQGKLDCVGMR